MSQSKSSTETTDIPPSDLEKTLRQQAEEAAQAKGDLTPEAVASLTPKEIQRLLHELQVHQIELEMQNEALRQSQNALEASRSRYFDLFDLAPVGYFTITPEGIIHEANLTAAILLGVSRNDLVQRPFTHFILPPDQNTYYLHNKKLSNSTPQTYEIRLKHANDDAPLWASINVIQVPDSRNYRLVITDITELRQHEAIIAEQHATLTAILESTNTAIFSLDRQYRYTAFNSTHANIMHTLYGVKIELGHSLPEYQSVPEDWQLAKKNLDRALQGESITESNYSGDDIHNRSYFEVTHHPIHITDGNIIGVSVFAKNITERKAAEQALQEAQTQLVEQERLSAVGQLAAGIAHDFNNILAIIMLHTELALLTQDLARMTENLRTVLKQSKHAASLVQQILDFGRRAIIQPQPLDLASFLFDQVKMLRRTIPENIQINLAVANEACIVSVDPNRFQQMITNLALNARDAMPIGGHLAIQVKRHHFIHDDETPLTDMPAGNWVQITFHDSGDGIEPEVLPHIFEPFFTTKAPGKGNGLGLAQVYGIVKQHNGYIDVQSAVGQGSTFMIYLPALGQNDTTISPTQPQTLPKGNGETVLIVEDNGVLREALIATVEMMNYSTKTAANGMEALNLLQEPSQNIAVVISDMVMPELGGDALFEAMQLRGLKTPMIILSGHPLDTKFVEILTAKGLVGFLMKPLDLKRLALLIDQAIQQAAA